ncbi:MAG TPA: DUF131 domain-containing protein [Candidatus Krumholzibacteriaceae bacterium]|nr:DUF131 domain-containing protein [Candidatus Krumholzibacteriaceae bacterium]
MEVSSGLLFVGVALTLLGALLVYLSLRAGPGELDAKAAGVIFIGPIPIIVGGNRKWIIAALGVTAIIMLYMISKQIRPDLIGW